MRYLLWETYQFFTNSSPISLQNKKLLVLKQLDMGITIEIILKESPAHLYRPGEMVRGILKLFDPGDADLSEGITITVFGVAKVEWSQRERVKTFGEKQGRTVTYSGSEDILECSIVLSCTNQQTDYPFSIKVPNIPALPWTMVTPHGSVEYGVKAELKRPWYKLGDIMVTVPISLYSHLNPRIAASLKNAASYVSGTTSNQEVKKVGFCCMPFCCYYLLSAEKIRMSLTTEALWSYPGKKLPFSLEVDNRSSKRELRNVKTQFVGISLHLAREKQLCGGGTWTKGEKATEMILHEQVVQMRLSPGDRVSRKGIFKVPMDAIPTQMGYSVLKVMYKLRAIIGDIKVFTCFDEEPTAVEVDVIIGRLEADGES